MALSAGTRLGAYEITARIGVGGMGEVYRAIDTNLGRQVAIKVLPDALVSDPERLARFDREARTLAALNHTNVAQLYGLERQDGGTALVMELVEGPTLADRLALGLVPLDEALPIAKQIAEGLEAAHERSIVHRDLKPSNVKLRADGVVKVLDFGLAKAITTTGPGDSSNASLSPTITTPAMTQAGMILGTAAYMSPEQARGRTVDTRTDIWAFGCVLFEMLTGHRAFEGDEVTDVLASVVKSEPDWRRLPPGTPSAIRTLLVRCLEKDPPRRLRDIGDARIEIDDVLSGRNTHGELPEPATTWLAWPRAVRWLAVVAVSALLGAAAVWVARPPRVAPSPTARFLVPLESAEELAEDVALSPDGKYVAYRSGQPGAWALRLRSLGDADAAAVAEFPDGRDPFFSPDSQWLGFFAGGKLRTVSVLGGPPTGLADAPSSRGGSWGDDGWIVYAPNGRSGLMRVPANGGTPEVLTSPDRSSGETSHTEPEVLPGSKALLYVARGETLADSHVTIMSLADGRARRLAEGSLARYVLTGHVLYRSSTTLMAAPLDLARLQLSSAPRPVAEGIAAFDSSDAGSLVYVPPVPPGAEDADSLVWMNRDGAVEPLLMPRGAYRHPRVSRDGRRIVLEQTLEDDSNVYVYDLDRQHLAKFTLAGRNGWPVWSPDGREILYAMNTVGTSWDLYRKRADGSPEEALLTRAALQHPEDVTPDGRFVAFSEVTPTGNDTWLLTLEDGTARPLLKGVAPSFSPDGRWVAFAASNASGRSDIYVQSISGASRLQVSTTGGVEPLWSPTGTELFYRDGNAVLAVDVQTEPTFTFGNARTLFEGSYRLDGLFSRAYDVTSDGKRFLMVARAPVIRPLSIVLNWQRDLLARVPAP